MPWFKVDDGFHGHPKVVDLTLEAIGLWTLAGSWCASYLTDGEITERAMTRLGGSASTASELVDAGLWVECADGFQFRDWEEYQPSKEQVQAERAASRARVQKWRAKKKGVAGDDDRTNDVGNSVGNAVTNGVGDGVSTEEVHLPRPYPLPLPYPLPNPSSSNEEDSLVRPKRKAPETPLPPDWIPSESALKYATENGIDIQHEAMQFRNHAAANDRRQRNWDAAFRTWLGNAKKWSRPQQSQMTAADRNAQAFRELYGGGDDRAGSIPALDVGIG